MAVWKFRFGWRHLLGVLVLAAGLVAVSLMPTPAKKFKLTAEQIRPLAAGLGACVASDMITVEGLRVAFMYREAPDNDFDSGWRFMAGFESDDYMSDPTKHGIYDVNTIANYDPDIIGFLKAPVGSAFERPGGTGAFVQVFDFAPPSEP